MAKNQMMKNSETAFFDDLQAGLLEGIAHMRGEIVLKTTVLALPEAPPPYDAAHIRALRTHLGMSQPYFSKLLNVSPKTVQSWEQGTRTPGQSSARLLQLIENPHLLDVLRRPQTVVQQEAAD